FLLEWLSNQGVVLSEFILFLSRHDFQGGKAPLWEMELSHYDTIIDGILTGQGRGLILPEYGPFYWDIEEASFLHFSKWLPEFYGELQGLVEEFFLVKGRALDTGVLSRVLE